MKDGIAEEERKKRAANEANEPDGCLGLITLPFELLGILLAGLLSLALSLLASLLAAVIPIAIAIFIALWAYRKFLVD